MVLLWRSGMIRSRVRAVDTHTDTLSRLALGMEAGAVAGYSCSYTRYSASIKNTGLLQPQTCVRKWTRSIRSAISDQRTPQSEPGQHQGGDLRLGPGPGCSRSLETTWVFLCLQCTHPELCVCVCERQRCCNNVSSRLLNRTAQVLNGSFTYSFCYSGKEKVPV